MKGKISSIFLLTVFLIMLVPASVLASDLRLELKDYPSVVQHDQGSFIISFDLTNSNKTAQAENLQFSSLVNKEGTWQLPTISVIAADSTQTLEAVFNLDPYQIGDFLGSISVEGYIDGDLNNAVVAISRGRIQIDESPSVEITNVGTLSGSQNSTTFKVKNTGNEPLVLSLSVDTLEYKSGKEIDFTLNQTSLSINTGQEQEVEVSAEIPSDLDIGEYTTKIHASSIKSSAEADLKVSRTYCKYGRVGSDIEIVSIKDRSSGDDWEWRPLDDVEIEVKVENNGDDNEDITVDIDLYDPENNDVIDFEDGDNEDTISIDEDDSEIFKFNVKIPSDIEERNYRLYVKAYIDGDEDVQCTDVENSDDYVEVDVNKESREVIIDDVVVPISAECKETAEIYAKVYNIGSKDEDRVKVTVYNKELGIDQESSSFELDEGDSKKVYFDLHVPEDAEEKTYSLELKAFYYYKDSNEEYREESTIVRRDLKVEGNCQIERQAVGISAILESEARAGKELVVKATITNTGTTDANYIISVSGNQAWSDLKSVEPISLSLKPSESKEVLVTLDVSKAASGEQSFLIRALYNGQTTEQPVSVFIEKGGVLTGFTIGEGIGENWFIWLIVAVNVILIILIIVVAVRASRK